MERYIQLSGVISFKVIKYENEDDLINLLKLKMPDIRFVGGDYHGKPFTGSNLEMEIFYNNREHPFSSRELKNRVIHWAFDGHHYYSKAEVEKLLGRIKAHTIINGVLNDTHVGVRNSSQIFIDFQKRFYEESLFSLL